jgi:hypothetical protein
MVYGKFGKARRSIDEGLRAANRVGTLWKGGYKSALLVTLHA